MSQPTEGQLRARKLLSRVATADSPSSAERIAYLRSAAVLVAIRHPERLRPCGAAREGVAQQILGRDLRPSNVRAMANMHVLEVQARLSALDGMNRADIEEALRRNHSERTGWAQEMYEGILLGHKVGAIPSGTENLEMAVQILTWLRDVRDVGQILRQANSRLEFDRYLAPFETLASDDKFVGRQRELDVLRQSVGVLAPEALSLRLHAALTTALSREVPTALSMYGPGGVGKSTLVARFVLEHLRLPVEQRVPIAYLDFDRPDRDIADLSGMVVEVIRQVRLQQGNPAYDQVLSRAKNQALTRPRESPLADNAKPDHRQIANATMLLTDLVEALCRKRVPGPLVIILDSFEEVQYRNEARAQAFWTVVQSLRSLPMQVRTIVSGRAPVRSFDWNKIRATGLEIGELDAAAADAFMAARGFDYEEDRAAIIRVVGRMPLSLVLASTLLREQQDRGLDGLDGLRGKRRIWFSASDGLIQGQLYERILSHIHDARVRKLAHPGLVLRRVTSELIRDVLDKPCGLHLSSDREARELFEALKRETSLVTVDTAEDAVVHRRDLRAVMLKLIEARSPALVQQIHLRARDWYKRGRGLRAVAEFCYHSLHLGELPEKWLQDSEIRASIQASINDFSPAVQRSMRSLGFQLEVEQGDVTETSERSLVVSVEQGLPYAGVTSGHLLGEITRAYKSTPSLSVAMLGWRMCAESGDPDKAQMWMERADRLSTLEPDVHQRLAYLSDKCWHLVRSDTREKLFDSGYLQSLGSYAARISVPWAVAQFRLMVDFLVGPKALDVVLSTEEALGRLDSRDLWAVFPVIGAAVFFRRSDPWSVDTWLNLATLIVDPAGPMVRSELAQAERARDQLVALARRALDDAPQSVADQIALCDVLASAVIVLAQQWPYVMLRVEPAFGSGGDRLAESAA